jgi:hypothetical protein
MELSAFWASPDIQPWKKKNYNDDFHFCQNRWRGYAGDAPPKNDGRTDACGRPAASTAGTAPGALVPCSLADKAPKGTDAAEARWAPGTWHLAPAPSTLAAAHHAPSTFLEGGTPAPPRRTAAP